MKPTPITRPQSLREVALESVSYRDFGANLKDFLHEFSDARRRSAPLEPMLGDAPPRLAGRFAEGRICDAFLAGTADYLARSTAVATPTWALSPDLVLEEPWFSEPLLGVRGLLLRDTPSAFKDKNVFVFESALSVA
jgi:hypothetical protein